MLKKPITGQVGDFRLEPGVEGDVEPGDASVG